MFRNILVPIDLEYPKSATRVVETAMEIAPSEGAEATATPVVPKPADDSAGALSGYRSKLDAFLAVYRESRQIEAVLEIGGSIAAATRQIAGERGADLIVLGARDSHFTDCMIGSNAARVAMHTPCAAMLVR